MNDRPSTKLGSVIPSYTAGYVFKELKECLPDYVIEALKEGIKNFDKKIKGYGNDDAILTGIETRTSAPVTIHRNETLESIVIKYHTTIDDLKEYNDLNNLNIGDKIIIPNYE